MKFISVSRKAALRVRFGKPYGAIRTRTRRAALEEFVKACQLKEYRITPGIVFELETLAGEWHMAGLNSACEAFIERRGLDSPSDNMFAAAPYRFPQLTDDVLNDEEIRKLPPEKFYELLIEADEPLEAEDLDEDDPIDSHQLALTPERLTDAVLTRLVSVVGDEHRTLEQIERDRQAVAPLILETDIGSTRLGQALEANAVHVENMNFFIGWSASHLRNKSKGLNRRMYRKIHSQLHAGVAMWKDHVLNEMLVWLERQNRRAEAILDRVELQTAQSDSLGAEILKIEAELVDLRERHRKELAELEAEVDEMIEQVKLGEELDDEGQIKSLVKTKVDDLRAEANRKIVKLDGRKDDVELDVRKLADDIHKGQARVFGVAIRGFVDRVKPIRKTKEWPQSFAYDVRPILGTDKKMVEKAVKEIKNLDPEAAAEDE